MRLDSQPFSMASVTRICLSSAFWRCCTSMSPVENIVSAVCCTCPKTDLHYTCPAILCFCCRNIVACIRSLTLLA